MVDEERRQTGVAGCQTTAVFLEVGVEEGAVVEEDGPVVFGGGGGPGEDGDGFRGAEERGVVLGEEDAAAEAVAGEVFGHAVEDVDEVWVDEVGGGDCEGGGEGEGGGVGRGLVGGFCVDFVGDEVDFVALAEAHVGFEGVD